ncbi:hsp20/alpha crystallin family domain-containing protein [Phthorimaea operculella]|nr:hsp20/alpha crystallin family domain-containing protein [Phthorimaea operculella]
MNINTSLLPYLIDRRRGFDHFISEDDLYNSIMPFMSGDNLLRARDGSLGLKTDKNNFQINLDVHHFAPEEVSVKIVDGFVVVEGKHEEKRDEHGWVCRQFTRRYALPEGCVAESVQSRLSSDGVLTVVAPLVSNANERVVPIIHTGPVRKESQSVMK